MSGPPGDDEQTRIVPPPPPPPPPPAMQHGNALPLNSYLGEFELTSIVGEGGFGIVYDAWDHSLERRVAVKEYMPASLASRENTQVRLRSARHRETFDAGLKSFVNEARLLAQFDHPSLVKVYRFWESNGTAYMVMPLYQGITLKDKLKEMFRRAQPADEPWLMNLLAPLTEALGVIHAEHCYHRDIAPDNIILLAGSERPLLLDFGAARRVIGDMTQALTVILKPGYAPVEQYAETPNMKQGSWTDVYALAATVHWAITGKTPPPSVSRLMSDGYVPLVETAKDRFSPSFLAGLDKALKVRPDERTHDIAELRADLGLDAWAASQPVTRIRTVQPVHVAPTKSTRGSTTPAPADLASGTGPTDTVSAAPPAPARPPTESTARAPSPQGTRAMTAGGAVPLASEATRLVVPLDSMRGFGEAGANGASGIDVELGEPSPRSPVASLKPQRSRVGLAVGAGVGALAIGVAAYLALGRQSAPPPAPSPSPAPVNPVTPPAPTPAPAPAPAPFEAQREFDRVLAAQTPGFDVGAKAIRPTLHVGRHDRLSFEVSSSRDGFVHVLLIGPDRSLTLLLPNETTKDHRIKAGQRLVLPDKGWPLEATEPLGSERFLVVVSETPRDWGSLAKGSEPPFRSLHTGAEATAAVSSWPASTPPLAGLARGCAADAPCNAFGAASFSIEVAR